MVTRDTTKTVITLKGDEEINRVETKESLIYCDECGKEMGHYHQWNSQCAICKKDLCEDHRIPTPEVNGGVTCSDCYRVYAVDIKNLNTNKQAMHDALIGITKAGIVYDSVIDTLLEKGKQRSE